MPVDPSLLSKHRAAIEREYGGGSVHYGIDEPPLRRIPTGNTQLDWAMAGGVPVGRWARFWGPYSGGKSLVAWHTVREAQKMGMTVAFYDIEKSFQESYVSDLGVDTKKLIVVEGSTIEHVGTKLETLLGSVHYHILDSTSAGVSVEELRAKNEEDRRALQARTWMKVLRKVHERMDKQENTILYISQARVRMDFADGYKEEGGEYLKHLSAMTAFFRQGKSLYRVDDQLIPDYNKASESLSGKKDPHGLEIHAEVKKNKTGTPRRSAIMRYDFENRCWDHFHDLVRFATHRDFRIAVRTSEASSWYEIDGKRVQGEKGLRKLFAEDEDLRNRILEAARSK